MAVTVRAATPADALAMATLINEIIEIGGTTAFRDPFDAARVVRVFIAPRAPVSCVIALDPQEKALGFQALERSDPDH